MQLRQIYVIGILLILTCIARMASQLWRFIQKLCSNWFSHCSFFGAISSFSAYIEYGCYRFMRFPVTLYDKWHVAIASFANHCTDVNHTEFICSGGVVVCDNRMGIFWVFYRSECSRCLSKLSLLFKKIKDKELKFGFQWTLARYNQSWRKE